MPAARELPGDPMEKSEEQRRVLEVVYEMPELLREILLISYFHRFPYNQMSEILGIPLGTLKSRLHTAVLQFAKRWRARQLEGPKHRPLAASPLG